MALNRYERGIDSISHAFATNGKLPDGSAICDECHGAGLRAGSSIHNPKVCDVCHGKGTLTVEKQREQFTDFRVR